MNNLETLLQTVDKISISMEERVKIREEILGFLGLERLLSNTIEEIAELINILSKNVMTAHCNFLHAAEEVVDVMSMTTIIKQTGIVAIDHQIEEPFTKSVSIELMEWIDHLSRAQQYISKYIRYRKHAMDKIETALFLLDMTTAQVIERYHISLSLIKKIETLKYKRLKDKLKENNIR